MSDWIAVMAQTALTPGKHTALEINSVNINIVLFNIEGTFYAIEDQCTHDGTEISSGKLQGEEIVCPRHGARFCVKTGAVNCPPAYEPIPTFPVKVEAGMVYIQLS